MPDLRDLQLWTVIYERQLEILQMKIRIEIIINGETTMDLIIHLITYQ